MFPLLRKRKTRKYMFRCFIVFYNRGCNPLLCLVWLLSQRISLLFQSDKGFFTIPLSKDFFTIPVRQRIYYSSHKGFLYYSSPTEDSLLFLSLKGFLYYYSLKGFFTIPVRQRILYYSSLKWSLYYSSPTKDYFITLESDLNNNIFMSFEKAINIIVSLLLL